MRIQCFFTRLQSTGELTEEPAPKPLEKVRRRRLTIERSIPRDDPVQNVRVLTFRVVNVRL